eukprot:COSAG01_NODE_5935_length_3944_cov_24.526658_4_plen_134_part_00
MTFIGRARKRWEGRDLRAAERLELTTVIIFMTKRGYTRYNIRHLLTRWMGSAKVHSFFTRGEKLDGCGILWLVHNARLHNIRLYTLVYTLGTTCTMYVHLCLTVAPSTVSSPMPAAAETQSSLQTSWLGSSSR